MPKAIPCSAPKPVSSSANWVLIGSTIRLITVRSNCETIEASASSPATTQPRAGLGQSAGASPWTAAVFRTDP